MFKKCFGLGDSFFILTNIWVGISLERKHLLRFNVLASERFSTNEHICQKAYCMVTKEKDVWVRAAVQ